MNNEVFNLRIDCHKLIEVIWGKGRADRKLAYIWLDRNCGGAVHFSQIFEIDRLNKIKVKLETLKANQGGKTLRPKKTDPDSEWGAWLRNTTKARRRTKKANKNNKNYELDSWDE